MCAHAYVSVHDIFSYDILLKVQAYASRNITHLQKNMSIMARISKGTNCRFHLFGSWRMLRLPSFFSENIISVIKSYASDKGEKRTGVGGNKQTLTFYIYSRYLLCSLFNLINNYSPNTEIILGWVCYFCLLLRFHQSKMSLY